MGRGGSSVLGLNNTQLLVAVVGLCMFVILCTTLWIGWGALENHARSSIQHAEEALQSFDKGLHERIHRQGHTHKSIPRMARPQMV